MNLDEVFPGHRKEELLRVIDYYQAKLTNAVSEKKKRLYRNKIEKKTKELEAL